MTGERRCWQGGRKSVLITLCHGACQAAPADPVDEGVDRSLGPPHLLIPAWGLVRTGVFAFIAHAA